MKTIALGFLATAIAATSALAGDETVNKDYKQPVTPVPCFRDQEFQVDLFGSFMNQPFGDDRFDHGQKHERDGGGGGLGLNYFFLRYVGIGADGDIDSNRGGVVNYTGKLILRLPIETGKCCFAPYIFGGGGGETYFENDFGYFHQRDRTEGAWMAGGGIEWRITPRIGLFAEGRYTWVANSNREGENDRARLGLRFAF